MKTTTHLLLIFAVVTMVVSGCATRDEPATLSMAQASPETAALQHKLTVTPEIKKAFHSDDSIKINSGLLHVTIYDLDNHDMNDNAYAGLYLGDVVFRR